jgi:pyrroline-5-carboxylate reductase
MHNTKILLVGCGKMGSSLLQGWLKSGVIAKNLYVVEPNFSKELQKFQEFGVNINPILKDDFIVDYCFIAVKPQNFDEVVAGYKFLADKKCCFISIAAGKKISKMEAILGVDCSIARAMPNLPATIGFGLTAVCFNGKASLTQKSIVVELFKVVGEVILLDEEDKINAITAISGSGPAYIFHVLEVLENVSKKFGFDDETALKLAKYVVYGSGRLAFESNKMPSELRYDVTSPQGTTEAALKVMMYDKVLENLFFDAIKAAEKRAKELGE